MDIARDLTPEFEDPKSDHICTYAEAVDAAASEAARKAEAAAEKL